MCPYTKIKGYHEMPLCEKQNSVCPMMRRCSERMVWLPLKQMETCKIRTQVEIPKNAYRVRFKKHGNLYVEIDNKVIMIPYDSEDTPQYVFLTKRNGIYKIKKGDNAK